MSEVKPSIWEMTAELPRFPKFEGEKEFDIVIIGGGITGITLAYQLRNSGLKICLLERHRLMRGTSGQTSAHLSSLWDMGLNMVKEKHGVKYAEIVFQAMSAAIEFIYEQSQLTRNASEFSFVNGYMFRENVKQETLAREHETCEDIGHSIVDMPKNFPLKYLEGFGVKTQGRFHPIKHVGALLPRIQDAKVEIYEDSGVTSFTSNTVATDQGLIKAKKIIHATHTPAGFNIVQNTLKPMLSYVLAAKLDKDFPDGLFVDNADPYHYIRKYKHEGQSYLIVGGADSHVGDGHEAECMQDLEKYTREKLGLCDIVYRWSAQYFVPIDGIPLIGKDLTHNNHYIATGFSGDGLTMGTAAALMLSDLIIKGSHPWEEYFSPARSSLINTQAVKMGFHVGKHLVKDRLKMDDINPDELTPGQGCVHASLTSPTAYFKDENGTVHSMSAVCPHLKCVVHWNQEQKSFDCPCHGSRFNSKGEAIEGPALDNLKGS